ncbi:prepilin-type N-terminal cleavage/methylation domain-containing protein [Candidatus Babeliales bacterium]|nr:prepilin-type N-terminal cleavage/methylation domain-containing protein [Candidatus Babeliales bacterium]
MKKPYAFTLIEMLVVIVLIGIIATMTIPRLMRRSPSTEWPNIVDEMNNLVSFARQEAICTQRVHRLRIKAGKETPTFVVVEDERTDPENPQKKIYHQVASDFFETRYDLAQEIAVNAVFIGKRELFAQSREAFCYIISDGLVQDVLLHLSRQEDKKVSQVSLKMNPFLGTFTLLDGHVKPEK